MPITIQEIIASDTISQLVDKTNFNFDQLLLNGGGPAGPPGIQGPIGPVGGRGPKGTTWFEDTSTVAPGATPTAVPPTATPLAGDYYLQFNGDVWEYVSTVWLQTTINLEGPQGPTGPPGGFGERFGFGTITNENTLYNGQVGTTATGVSVTNEGVPSILVGGISSNYNPAVSPTPTVPLTAAYLLPANLEVQLQSSFASLMIHQKDNGGRSIIFHGGNAPGNTNNYEQSNINLLSNITLGVNDRLLLNIPKSAVGLSGTASMDDLIGFQVNSDTRSHSHNAGQQIRLRTGLDSATYGVIGENSNFEISVGTGNLVTDNKFVVSTLSSGAETDMQMGGSITLSTGQITNPGVLQFLNGVTRFDVTANGSGTGAFRVNAQGSISLNTNVANRVASPPINLTAGGSGGITLNTQTGNINIDGAGTIRIAQTSATATATENILISNSSTNNIGTGGNITIEGNAAIILKNEVNSVFDAPSIAINMDGGEVPPPTPPNAAHTAFIGDQTWAPVSFGNFTIPISNISKYDNIEGVLINSSNILHRSGTTNTTDWEPGSTLRSWFLATGATSGTTGGAVEIRMGNESLLNPVPSTFTMPTSSQSTSGMYDPAYDNSAVIEVSSSTLNDNQYFSASIQKTAIANPFVFKRTQARNSTGNRAPGITSPGIVNVGGQASSNFPSFGYDLRSVSIPSSATPTTFGMPTTADLAKSPFITLRIGIGLGQLQGGLFGGPYNQAGSIKGYDYSLQFPTGAYPGQRIIVTIENYSIDESINASNSFGKIRAEAFGKMRVNIPLNRKWDYGAGQWSSWNDSGSAATNGNYTNDGTRAYVQFVVETDATDANNAMVKKAVLELIWDGTVVNTYARLQFTPTTAYTNPTQNGWHVINATFVKNEFNRNVYP